MKEGQTLAAPESCRSIKKTSFWNTFDRFGNAITRN